MLRKRRAVLLAVALVVSIGAAPGLARGAVLYSQLDSQGGFGLNVRTSQSNEIADDFTVPPGVTWTIDGVTPTFFAATAMYRVTLYPDNGLGTAPPVSGNLFTQDTATPAALSPTAGPLTPGHYWVAVQDVAGTGMGWRTRTVQSGSGAVYDNPGAAACPRWTPITCAPGVTDHDMLFALTGVAIPIASPAATPTPVAKQCRRHRRHRRRVAARSAKRKRCRRHRAK
jgi:hypothetical protein